MKGLVITTLVLLVVLISGCTSSNLSSPPAIESTYLIINSDITSGHYNNLEDTYRKYSGGCAELEIQKVNYSRKWLSQVKIAFENNEKQRKFDVILVKDRTRAGLLTLQFKEFYKGKLINSKALNRNAKLNQGYRFALNVDEDGKFTFHYGGKVYGTSFESAPTKAVYHISNSQSEIRLYDVDGLDSCFKTLEDS